MLRRPLIGYTENAKVKEKQHKTQHKHTYIREKQPKKEWKNIYTQTHYTVREDIGGQWQHLMPKYWNAA